MAQVFGDFSDREPSPLSVYGGSSTPGPSANTSFVNARESARTSAMPATTPSPRVDEDTHPVSSSFTPSCSVFAKLASLIPDENELRFTTATDLADDIEVKIGDCLKSETGCYMLVTGVAEDMVEPIEEEMEKLGIRKVARFTYEQTIESLIIRLMPGASHENVSRSLWRNIDHKVSNLPGHSAGSLIAVGASTFDVPGQRSKQGDDGFRPRDTREAEDQWPTVMIEVGYSESLPALRLDAKWWLVHSGGQTKMVIIAKITKNPASLELECWEMVADPNRRVKRNSTPFRPGCTQRFEIDNTGTVIPPGRDLVIPYGTMFDTARPGDTDIVLPAGGLSQWALDIYATFV